MFARWLDSLRRRGSTSLKVGLGIAVGALAGGAFVSAQSPTSQVRACVQTQTDRPNTIIVGPGQPCPAGTTAKTWSVQGPRGPAGPVTGAALTGLTEPGASPRLDADFVRRELRRKSKRRSLKLKVVGVSASSPSFPSFSKQRYVPCPSTHPKLVTGGIKLDPPASPSMDYSVVANYPVYGKGWFAAVNLMYGQGKPWKLTVKALCAKK